MRSLLALFVIAALGFAVILKKDESQPAAPIKPDKLVQSPRQKLPKQKRERPEAQLVVSHVAVNEREQIAAR